MLSKLIGKKENTTEFEFLMQRAKLLDVVTRLQAMKDLQATIWRRLQSHLMLTPFTSPDHNSGVEVNQRQFWIDNKFYHDITYISDINIEVDLGKEIVLTNPWHPKRILDNLGMIGINLPNGRFTQSTNHSVNLYWPLNVGIVTGGNHSIAQAILRGDGKVRVEDLYDFSKIVEQVFYDGEYWIEVNSGRKFGKPAYKEIGWAWELGRKIMKYETFEEYLNSRM